MHTSRECVSATRRAACACRRDAPLDASGVGDANHAAMSVMKPLAAMRSGTAAPGDDDDARCGDEVPAGVLVGNDASGSMRTPATTSTNCVLGILLHVHNQIATRLR
jgi:hypothetical protein